MVEDNISKMERIRPVSRGFDPKGRTIKEIFKPSTVIMSSGWGTDKAGEKVFFAYPTLFPKDPTSKTTTSSPDDWIEYEYDDWRALDMAKERKEVFIFDTKKEAEEFALGSWKPKLEKKKMADAFNKMLHATESDKTLVNIMQGD